jgi:ketosteroid isomerase-like protein
MEIDEQSDDIRAIKALIHRQFASLNWTPETPADWNAFAADFYPDASLFPSARPAKRQSVQEFIERMKGLAGTRLRSFHETALGVDIRVFGNVAVAVAANQLTENDGRVSRNVEMLLLLKTDGEWNIAAQAWDGESTRNRIPAYLTAGV